MLLLSAFCLLELIKSVVGKHSPQPIVVAHREEASVMYLERSFHGNVYFYWETITSVSETNQGTDRRHFIFSLPFSLFVLDLPVFFLVSYPTERRGRKGETLHPSAVKQGNGVCCPKNGDVGRHWPGMEDQSDSRSWRRTRTVL